MKNLLLLLLLGFSTCMLGQNPTPVSSGGCTYKVTIDLSLSIDGNALAIVASTYTGADTFYFSDPSLDLNSIAGDVVARQAIEQQLNTFFGTTSCEAKAANPFSPIIFITIPHPVGGLVPRYFYTTTDPQEQHSPYFGCE